MRDLVTTYPETGRTLDAEGGLQLWIGPAAPEHPSPQMRTDTMLCQLCDVYGLTSDDLTAALPHVDPTHTAWVWQLNAAMRPFDPFMERFLSRRPWPQAGDPEPRPPAGIPDS